MNRHPFARLALTAALLLAQPLSAKEIAGVTLPDEVALEGADKPLVLNGAGIREKFFVDVYVGALYLAEKTTDAETAIDAPGAKRVLMHFVYKEMSKEKLVDGWREGFEPTPIRRYSRPSRPESNSSSTSSGTPERGTSTSSTTSPVKGPVSCSTAPSWAPSRARTSTGRCWGSGWGRSR